MSGVAEIVSSIFSSRKNTTLVDNFLLLEKTLAQCGRNILSGRVRTEAGDEIPLVVPKAKGEKEIDPVNELTLYFVEEM